MRACTMRIAASKGSGRNDCGCGQKLDKKWERAYRFSFTCAWKPCRVSKLSDIRKPQYNYCENGCEKGCENDGEKGCEKGCEKGRENGCEDGRENGCEKRCS